MDPRELGTLQVVPGGVIGGGEELSEIHEVSD